MDDAARLADARLRAEAFLRDHVQPGSADALVLVSAVEHRAVWAFRYQAEGALADPPTAPAIDPVPIIVPANGMASTHLFTGELVKPVAAVHGPGVAEHDLLAPPRPPRPRVPVTTVEEARDRAEAHLDRFRWSGEDDPVVIVHEAEHAEVWVFDYQSLRFVVTGDNLRSRAGNAPVVVPKDGRPPHPSEGGTATSPESVYGPVLWERTVRRIPGDPLDDADSGGSIG